MSQEPQSAIPTHARGPRIGIGIELRATRPGPIRYAASSEHVLSVHAGAPVRVSCSAGEVASLRTRGQINILPAGVSDDCFEDDASHTVDLRLSPSLVQLAAGEMGLDPGRAGVEMRCHIRDVQIENIAWALEAEYRAQFPSGLVYRESLAMALAVRLLAGHRAQSQPRGGLSSQQLRRATEYVDAHLAGDVSLLTIARVAGVSASHFRALFKRTTGVAVHAYVIQRRVERARALLMRGELSLSQIAFDTGFSHQSHLARCMRRVLGVTPAVIAGSRA